MPKRWLPSIWQAASSAVVVWGCYAGLLLGRSCQQARRMICSTCSIHAVLWRCVGSCLASLGCQIGSTRLGFYLGVLLFRFFACLERWKSSPEARLESRGACSCGNGASQSLGLLLFYFLQELLRYSMSSCALPCSRCSLRLLYWPWVMAYRCCYVPFYLWNCSCGCQTAAGLA